ncbi:MAG TPA: leucine-rich repeat domain-containing protein [Candidatus Saccharimonadales bacterium]|nr:leucine-rich repeat domain-containing protein [Candidatus Saccharimonadales bacterium]
MKVYKIILFSLLVSIDQMQAGVILKQAMTHLEEAEEEAVKVATKEFADLELTHFMFEYINRLKSGGFITEMDDKIFFELLPDLSIKVQNLIKKNIQGIIQDHGFFVTKFPLSPWLQRHFGRYLLPLSRDPQDLMQGYIASKLGYLYVNHGQTDVSKVEAFIQNQLPAIYVSDLEQGVFSLWFDELRLQENAINIVKNAVTNILRQKIKNSGNNFIRLKIGILPDWISSEFKNYTDMIVPDPVLSDFVATQRDGYLYIDSHATVAQNFLRLEQEQIQEILQSCKKIEEIRSLQEAVGINFIIVSQPNIDEYTIAIRKLVANNPDRTLVVYIQGNITPRDFRIPYVRNALIIGRKLITVDQDFLMNHANLVSVQLPAGIMYIRKGFFYKAISLESLKLPAGVIYIADNFLNDCIRLKLVQLSLGLSWLGNDFLKNCDSLDNIQFPVGIIQVGDGFLYNCKNLVNVQLPMGLIRVGNGFLLYCNSLVNIQLPRGLAYVGDQFLWGCSKLISLLLPAGLIHIGQRFLDECIGLKTLYVGKDFPQLEIDKIQQKRAVKNLPALQIIRQAVAQQ